MLSEDYIDTTSILAEQKRSILKLWGWKYSKFSRKEIDLSQADINGTAIIEVTALFGGATLVVPSTLECDQQCGSHIGWSKG